tara:strand:+ start:99 stop:317 length:219 start_codon:yes stop_codon:yes gene_type:complete
MKKYTYTAQFNSEFPLSTFNNINDLATYLNESIGIPVYTKDIIYNYFYDRSKKINPLMKNIFQLERQLVKNE